MTFEGRIGQAGEVISCSIKTTMVQAPTSSARFPGGRFWHARGREPPARSQFNKGQKLYFKIETIGERGTPRWPLSIQSWSKSNAASGGYCNWIYLVEENNQNGGAKLGKHWIEESFLNIDTGLLTGLQRARACLKNSIKEVLNYLIKFLLQAALVLSFETRPILPREDSLILLAGDHVILDKVRDNVVFRVEEPASNDFQDAKQKEWDAVSQDSIAWFFCWTKSPDKAEDSESTRKNASADCCDSLKCRKNFEEFFLERMSFSLIVLFTLEADKDCDSWQCLDSSSKLTSLPRGYESVSAAILPPQSTRGQVVKTTVIRNALKAVLQVRVSH